MSDLFDAPPPRPAPDRLRQRIDDELSEAAGHHGRRRRYAVIPLVAASLIGASVLGASLVNDDQTVAPAQTATPVTAAPRPSPSAPATSATPSASRSARAPRLRLDVRQMTKAEVRSDTQSCLKAGEGSVSGQPDSVAVWYAALQRSATPRGALAEGRRVLVVANDVGVWSCENGAQAEWRRNGRAGGGVPTGLAAAPSVAFGSTTTECGDGQSSIESARSFTVTDEVAEARIRFALDERPGPWQTVRPDRGQVLFPFVLSGTEAEATSAAVQYQFLDRAGQPLPVQVGDGPETSTGTTVEQAVRTCADLRKPPPVERVRRPADDAAGLAACRSMIKEMEPGRWRSVLVISTAGEWGAVLTDGKQRVGCSLFPTREISPFVTDSPTADAAAFRFALNPVPGTDGSSLWAAGRVPADVSAITYRLPNGIDVAATIGADGYWMLKFHSDGEVGTGDDVDDWEPVVVTVRRGSSTTTHRLRFTEQNMCNQVSHGC